MSRLAIKGSVPVMVLVVFLIGAIPASAEIPEKINYQGKLADAVTGEPIAGSQAMTFRLFDDPSSGSLLWSETASVSADSAGIFSVILGGVTPIDVSFGRPVWLEIEIDSEVLSPRRELVSVPYSFHAANSDVALDAGMLDGLNANAFADTSHSHDGRYHTRDSLSSSGILNEAGNPVDWTRLKNVPAGFADGTDDEAAGTGDGHSLDASDGDPGDALYVDQYGKVGIGTTAPEQPLHVFKDQDAIVEIVIENPNTGAYSAERLSFDNEDGSLAGIAAFDQTAPLYPSQMKIFNNRPNGSINLDVEGISVITLRDGRMGIREPDPDYVLDVDGTASMTGFKMPTSAASGYVLMSGPDGTGSWQPAAVGDGHSLDAVDGAPVDALYVGISGSVGIGTTVPQQKLHLDGGNSEECFLCFTHDAVGATPTDGLTIGIDQTGDVRFWNREAGNMTFGTNAAPGMTIDSDGRVGIGTSFPTQTLQVEESGSVWAWVNATGPAGIAGLRVSNSIGSWDIGVRSDADDALVIRDNTPGTDRFMITQSGRVGIGTNDPEERLHLHGGSSPQCFTQFTHNGTGATQDDGLLIGIDDDGDARFINNEARYMSFGTDATERIRITGDGDVGIGTYDPQTRLHIHAEAPSEASYVRFTTLDTGGGFGNGTNFGVNSDGHAYIWNYETADVRIGTGGSEKVRITPDGKVGIFEMTPEVRLEMSGVQRIMGPPSWPTTGEGMEFGYNSGIDRGYIQVYDRVGATWGQLYLGARQVGIGELDPSELLDITGNDPYIALNTTNNKTGIRLQKNGADNWEMAWNQGSGYLYFYNAATRMVIEDATGDVGIGTSTPGYKLDVAGPAHASSFPTSSDARFKENVEQLTGVLDKLDRVRGVRFDWNSRYESLGRATGHREIGVIAQEIEEEFPELVTTWGDEDYRAVDYGRMAGVFIEAIRELRSENEALRQRLEALEAATN